MSFQNSFQNGRYTILSQLGIGGIASVWRVFDNLFEMEKAIKVLRPHTRQYGQTPLPSEISQQSNTQIKRFFREAKVMMQLEHHNILRVYDYFEENGAFCIIMENCMGSLDTWVSRNGVMSEGLTIQVASQVLQGLHQAHTSGLIHRDIKPHNILISRSGVIKVADFGLAMNSMSSEALTKTNALLGSVQFMSPEQRNNPTKVSSHSDLYAVAQTMVYLLYGQTLGDLYIPSTLERLQERASPALIDIIRKAGALEVVERFQSALDMLEALQQIEVSTESKKGLLFGLALQEISIDDLHPSIPPSKISSALTSNLESMSPAASVEMVVPKFLYALLSLLTLSIVGLIYSVIQSRSPSESMPFSASPTTEENIALPQCVNFIDDKQSSFLLGPKESYNVTLQDINGDGRAEAFFVNLMDRSISMYLNEGQSRIDNIQPTKLTVPRMMTPPIFADIDKDGLLDLVGIHIDQSRITISKGLPSNQFRKIETFGRDEMLQEPAAMHGALYDLNEDGYPDLIFQERGPEGTYPLSIRYNAKKGLDYAILNLPNTEEEPLNWHKRLQTTDHIVTFGVQNPSIFWIEGTKLLERTINKNETLSAEITYDLPVSSTTLIQILENQAKNEIFLLMDQNQRIIQWQRNGSACILMTNFPHIEYRNTRRLISFGYWNDDETLDYILAKTCTQCDSNHWLYVSQ